VEKRGKWKVCSQATEIEKTKLPHFGQGQPIFRGGKEKLIVSNSTVREGYLKYLRMLIQRGKANHGKKTLP